MILISTSHALGGATSISTICYDSPAANATAARDFIMYSFSYLYIEIFIQRDIQYERINRHVLILQTIRFQKLNPSLAESIYPFAVHHMPSAQGQSTSAFRQLSSQKQLF